MPTIQERMAEFQAKRTQLAEQKSAIVNKACVEEGRTLDENETEQDNQLAADIDSIDKTIATLKSHEALMVTKAAPVVQNTGQGQGSVHIPGAGVIRVERNLPVGTAFTRYAIALARAKGNVMHAEQIAKQWHDSTPEVELFIKQIVQHGSADAVFKTAVAAGTTTDSTWAQPLVYAQNMAADFIEYLRPKTILGRMPSLRKVPFNVRIPRQTAGTTGSFVGEGLPIPVGKLSFDSITLTWAKASTIVVLTEELVRNSNPAAETLVRDDLAAGISAYLDKRFIDPSYAGVSGTSPASISNGVTSRQASGVTLAAIDSDVNYLFTQMANSELDMSTCVWVMQPATAIRLSTVRTTNGPLAFPEINVQGGMFKGFPVIVSNNTTASNSPGEEQVFLVCQNEILLSDDGQMLLDMSNEAALQMNDAPSSSASSVISMWQTDQVALKCDRWINWSRRRSASVQYVEQAQRWGS